MQPSASVRKPRLKETSTYLPDPFMYEYRHSQIQITVRRKSERLCTPFFQQFINSPYERSFLTVLCSYTESDAEPAEDLT
jgi:hypothetical protein